MTSFMEFMKCIFPRIFQVTPVQLINSAAPKTTQVPAQAASIQLIGSQVKSFKNYILLLCGAKLEELIT